MKGSEALEIVGDLASQQWGLVTSAQAKDNGVDLPTLRRLAEHGALIRIRHGVYASTATGLSAELEVKAQWLALHPEMMAADRVGDPAAAVEAVVSHTTAAELWGIGDLWPDGIHFTVGDRRRSRQPDVQFHRAGLTGTDWTIHPDSGLPVTTAVRTIADLARADHEPGHLLGLVADAAKKSLLDEQDVLDAFAGQEDALGASRGDRTELRALLDGYFPEDRVSLQTRSVVDEALFPVQEQMNQLMRTLVPRFSWNGAIPNPLEQHMAQVTEPMHATIQAPKVNMFPGLAEEIRKAAGLKEITDSDAQHTEDEDDTRPDHHGTEGRSEETRPEAQ